MSQSNPMFVAFLKQMLLHTPVFFVYFLAIMIAVTRWSRHPLASLLAVVALGIMFGQSVLNSAIFLWLPQSELVRQGSVRLETAFNVVGIVGSLVHAVAIGLLVAAVFVERPFQRPNDAKFGKG